MTLEKQVQDRINREWDFYKGMTEGEIITDLIERVSETEIKIEALKDWANEKFTALAKPSTKTNFYSEDEILALKEACKGLGVLPKGAISEVCDQLIEEGWNDTYSKNRTSSALRTKYLRLIGEK
jgi:hypothetical protein